MPASVSAVRTVDTCRWDVGGFVSSATRRPVSGASVRASTLRTGPCAEGTTEDMGLLRSMSLPRREQNTAVLSSILRRSGDQGPVSGARCPVPGPVSCPSAGCLLAPMSGARCQVSGARCLTQRRNQLVEPSFYSGFMAGGMGRGRGVPLRDRVAMMGREPVPLPAVTPGPRRRRHCWVRPNPDDTTQVEGLVLQWAKEGDAWVALVQFVLERDGEAIAVQRWLPASRLRPA